MSKVNVSLNVEDVCYLIRYLRVKLNFYESINAPTSSMISDMEYLKALIKELTSNLN